MATQKHERNLESLLHSDIYCILTFNIQLPEALLLLKTSGKFPINLHKMVNKD